MTGKLIKSKKKILARIEPPVVRIMVMVRGEKIQDLPLLYCKVWFEDPSTDPILINVTGESNSSTS